MIIFLFNNGIYYDAGCLSSTLEEVEANFCYIDERRDKPYSWGAFIIENSEIHIQAVNSIRGFFQEFGVVEYHGEILTDTTIKLSRTPGFEGYDIWSFKQYSPKPDCTNIIVEKLGMPD